MLEPASFPFRGSDVLLNTVLVQHPNWHLYNQCSHKAGDLRRFSIYCHLPQFLGSFLPQHQSEARINSDDILAYLRQPAQTTLSQILHGVSRCASLPSSVSASTPGLVIWLLNFSCRCICMITILCHSFPPPW